MAGFLLAYKLSQSQLFNEQGVRMPVTCLDVPNCFLIDVKTEENDGYDAIQVAFGKKRRTPKSVKGQVRKVGKEEDISHIKEFRIEKAGKSVQILSGEKKGIKIGQKELFVGEQLLPADVFAIGESVDVSGTTKGKGFQGGMKRHGFGGGPKTHGQSDRARAPGSIGSGTTPGRVLKGKKMAGRMGGVRATVQNLRVEKIEETKMYIKGLVPGHINSVVEVRSHFA